MGILNNENIMVPGCFSTGFIIPAYLQALNSFYAEMFSRNTYLIFYSDGNF
jgi:hypothetical protein